MPAGEFRVVVAPDSFKGSLSAQDVAAHIRRGLLLASSDLIVDLLPVADGGEGTVEAFSAAYGAACERRCTAVTGPLGEAVEADWLLVRERSLAVVEMARASGLVLVPEAQRDPLVTTTRGTGELVLEAVRQGARRVLVTLGGSATVDGGTGLARALGYRFLDSQGRELRDGGGALVRLERIDTQKVAPEIQGLLADPAPDAGFVGLADVNNPLLGAEGAAAVYGPQKGAGPAAVRELDRGLARLAQVAARDLPRHGDESAVADRQGTGAAGGLGAGLAWFLGARLQPGADAVLDALGFEARVKRARAVITGEGRIDGQTSRGKVVACVARRAQAMDVEVHVIAGTRAPGWEEVVSRFGVQTVLTLAEPHDSVGLEAAVRDPVPRLEAVAATLYQDLMRRWR